MAEVSEVDFVIDGRLGWVEHQSPYDYGDDNNWLVTSFLRPGQHTFTLRVLTTDGSTASDTVTATTATPTAPPAALVGHWGRRVSEADTQRATSSQPPPAGRWGVTVDATGWHVTDPQGGGGAFDVAYLTATALQMRPTIETPPFPNASNGGFCDDTDPLAVWTFTTTRTALTVAPAGNDPCGDRVAILAGTWTRTSR